ncbi:MAG: TraR/DksA C4-type zinc finger protein [Bacteroidota bacterium]|jgi:DnaK suppressor protein|nr:TraR/DksA C4-type zinc finger protein [Bacteroidota bacterium]
MVKKKEENIESTRYSDADLQEFKQLIMGKLESAKDEFTKMQKTIQNPNENGDGNTSNQYLTLDDGASTFEKENLNQLAARQKKFIDNLIAALTRIENKTYGICRVTGKLIQKERLMAVPHATLSMEAKLNQYKNK